MSRDRLAQTNELCTMILNGFQNIGAQLQNVPSLLPADVLLDLYGEDIRMRAYTTDDPTQGEMVLRPDFTVPIVQEHMRSGANPARYCYSGSVWRKQSEGSHAGNEYLQVGYELFDGSNTAKADAEVFTLLDQALEQFNAIPCIGDVSILRTAIEGLNTSPNRRDALLRHVWRQNRFKTLLSRFENKLPAPIGRKELLQNAGSGVEKLIEQSGPNVGLRSVDEIKQRVNALIEDQAQPRLNSEEVDIIHRILSLEAPAGSALSLLRDLQDLMPLLEPSLDRMEARLDALAKQGIDIDLLNFQGKYGLDAMEYYDGFVFGFTIGDALVASGGRYDALTSVLGNGKSIPAVGGIIKPALVLSAFAGEI